MIAATPSHTAHRVAMRRAAHQLLDRPPVLVDPLAIAILGPDAAAVRADPSHAERDALAPYMRAFMAVRARFAEDQLARLRAAGLRQYVVLGAGLDTFAYRDPTPERPLRIWEVDYPATGAWKRERLTQAGIAVPGNLTFVPLDFERDVLADALDAAGFDATAGAFFAWLGVAMYLPADAVRATLAYVAGVTRAGGGVVFDYSLAPHRVSAGQRRVYDLLAARVEAAGEPWRSTFDPDELAAELHAMGFAVAEDVGPDALNARYLAGRDDGLRVGGLTHLMWAGTTPHTTE